MGIFANRRGYEADDHHFVNDAVLLASAAYPDSRLNPAIEQQLTSAGWCRMTAQQLGYTGKVDKYGDFCGELAGYRSAQVTVMRHADEHGRIDQIALAFRGTDNFQDVPVWDTLGDYLHDLSILLPDDAWTHYTTQAFGRLFTQVARFASAQGLSGSDITVTGHSLGGMAVNGMAASSATAWQGFYEDSRYIAFASPTENDKVFNIGFENDPVYHVLPGNRVLWPDSYTPTSPLAHHPEALTGTNHLVNFDDYYAFEDDNDYRESILNDAAWAPHEIDEYQSSVGRILDSRFYTLTERNSTLVISNLSEAHRQDTWVEDRNTAHVERNGPTFILGTQYDDLLRGGSGNHYIEGFAGNDTFMPGGGYNVIAGGSGQNSLIVAGSLEDCQVVLHGAVLYTRDNHNAINQASGISILTAEAAGDEGTQTAIDYQVGSNGLMPLDSHFQNIAYAPARSATGESDVLALAAGEWGFGSSGNDTIMADTANTVVVGSGDDQLISQGQANTFLFSGRFGHDTLTGLKATDRLIFSEIAGLSGKSYHDVASNNSQGVLLDVGEGSVELAGVRLDQLSSEQFVFV